MSSAIEIKVPDIGDFNEVEVIEVLVAAGQRVAAEDPLLTLESDKATMDIPAPQAGVIGKLLVQVGQKVSQGSAIAVLQVSAAAEAEPAAKTDAAADTPTAPPIAESKDKDGGKPSESDETPTPTAPTPPDSVSPPANAPLPHASPAVRRLARQLGAQLPQIHGQGRNGRITRQDVKDWVKQRLTAAAPRPSGNLNLPPMPEIDFSQFGEVEKVPLARIKKISGAHLQRAWLSIPHVTHHDEVDITELEQFRQSLKDEAAQQGVRLTLLAFVVKSVARALQEFPHFNASLHADGEHLTLKKYYNIGIAVDTPHGLVVPVLKAVAQKTIFAIAKEMGELSQLARGGKLQPQHLQGGCFSISSLGGIGGNAFTPIVNAPQVAILGVTRARIRACWDGKAFQPRLMLPLDLSYDHRVVDGAEAARMVAFITQLLADVRRLAL